MRASMARASFILLALLLSISHRHCNASDDNSKQPDKDISLDLGPDGKPLPFPKIVLWNEHNAIFNNSGTAECNIVLYSGEKMVWRKQGVELSKWFADEDTSTDIPIPKIAFDRIRVEVTKAVGIEGGLAEIEVYPDRWINVARGCAAKASAEYDSRFPAQAVTDGIRSSWLQTNKCYWMLPENTTGWIDVDLSKYFAPASVEVPKDATTIGKCHCKAFFENFKISWHQAEETCRKLGGHLVSVHSKDENEDIRGMAQGHNIWLGGTDFDNGKVGKWSWTDGTEFSFQNWHPGEPNNGGANKDEFWLGMWTDGSWNDFGRGQQAVDGYVCEWTDAKLSTHAVPPPNIAVKNDPSNLLFNPGFELRENGEPVGWKLEIGDHIGSRRVYLSKVTATSDATIKSEGKASVQLSHFEKENKYEEFATAELVSTPIIIDKQKKYKFRGKFKRVGTFDPTPPKFKNGVVLYFDVNAVSDFGEVLSGAAAHVIDSEFKSNVIEQLKTTRGRALQNHPPKNLI